MALFNDGPINLSQDLVNYENGILDLAAQEQIDLDGKIQLAQSYMSMQILALLLRQGTRNPFTNWIDPQDILRRQIGVGDVVVTGPLTLWHAMRSLASVYRDAYNNQLNDRYQKKWAEYQALEEDAKYLLYHTGVGICGYPLPRPAMPTLTATPGTGIMAQYFVQVTWLNQLAQESGPGPAAALLTTDGTQLTVTAPPVPPATPPGSQQNVTGWNAYVGTAPGAVALQTTTPVLLGAAWTLPASGPVAGNPPGPGQTPDYYVTDDHVLPRG